MSCWGWRFFDTDSGERILCDFCGGGFWVWIGRKFTKCLSCHQVYEEEVK